MADGPLVVILAAGLGTRMRSAIPKVLHPLGGLPLIEYTLAIAAEIGGPEPVVVVNPEQPEVRAAIGNRAITVDQAEPRGTGDALRSVPGALRREGPVLVLSADVPLVRVETVRRLLAAFAAGDAPGVLLSVVTSEPSGMGRLQRDPDGNIERIVEERDLPAVIPGLTECNAGVYVFAGGRLWPALERLSTDNAQGELYLTDVVEMIDGSFAAIASRDASEAIGINDRRQLAAAEAALQRRRLDALMAGGVTVADPATTYIDADVSVGRDSVLHPMTSLRQGTTLGVGCQIGPMAHLRAVRGGDRAVIGQATLEECSLGDDVRIGPYSRVRPNTVLGSGVELGTHAEVKNSTVGSGTRINHFSCVLDSDVGGDVNIGAGTVTCNYDGRAKHRTTIGDRVFVGSNATLVAPLRIAEGAYIAAGSVVTADVPADALAVGRERQRVIEGWAARRRAKA